MQKSHLMQISWETVFLYIQSCSYTDTNRTHCASSWGLNVAHNTYKRRNWLPLSYLCSACISDNQLHPTFISFTYKNIWIMSKFHTKKHLHTQFIPSKCISNKNIGWHPGTSLSYTVSTTIVPNAHHPPLALLQQRELVGPGDWVCTGWRQW